MGCALCEIGRCKNAKNGVGGYLGPLLTISGSTHPEIVILCVSLKRFLNAQDIKLYRNTWTQWVVGEI